jgi:hypothetical protein
VIVDVTSSPAVTGALKVWRNHPDGSRWRVLTEPNPVLVTSWTGPDYHAPFKQFVTYSVETDAGLSAPSGPVYIQSNVIWLVSASDPALSVQVAKLIGPAAAYTYADRSQRFQVLGRKLPVTRTDYPRGGASGQIIVKCETVADRKAVSALLADNGPVLINTPRPSDDIGWMWVQPGELTMSNPGGTQGFPFRYATIPFTEVSPPDADQAPVWTYEQVAAAFPDYATVATNYDDYRAMQLDIRTP